MPTPRDVALATESTTVPAGPYPESFLGYGVMGVPFRSGHVLALRRFPTTSVGPPYTSVWHRDPAGRWTFRQDAPAEVSCPRYFAGPDDRSERAELDLQWQGPTSLEVRGDDVSWQMELSSTPVSRVMSATASRLPDRAWQSSAVLGAMAAVAGPAMRIGRVGMQGTAPRGQRFQAHPLHMWMVAATTATIDGEDLGPPGPLDEQTRLGDFWIPQRGVFAVGRSFFEAPR